MNLHKRILHTFSAVALVAAGASTATADPGGGVVDNKPELLIERTNTPEVFPAAGPISLGAETLVPHIAVAGDYVTVASFVMNATPGLPAVEVQGRVTCNGSDGKSYQTATEINLVTLDPGTPHAPSFAFYNLAVPVPKDCNISTMNFLGDALLWVDVALPGTKAYGAAAGLVKIGKPFTKENLEHNLSLKQKKPDGEYTAYNKLPAEHQERLKQLGYRVYDPNFSTWACTDPSVAGTIVNQGMQITNSWANLMKKDRLATAYDVYSRMQSLDKKVQYSCTP